MTRRIFIYVDYEMRKLKLCGNLTVESTNVRGKLRVPGARNKTAASPQPL